MWKFRKSHPLTADEAKVMLDACWSATVNMGVRQLELEQRIAQIKVSHDIHRQRMDSKLSAIEKRLDKLEGIY